MQGSGLKQSSVGKAQGSHMWSVKVHEIFKYGSSKIWHCICDVSDTGVPYTEYNTKNLLFFTFKSIMRLEYDAGAPYSQNYLSNITIKNCLMWLVFLSCTQEISRIIPSTKIGCCVWGFPYFL